MFDSQSVTLESGGRDGGRGTVEFIISVEGLAIMPYELLTDVIKVNPKIELLTLYVKESCDLCNEEEIMIVGLLFCRLGDQSSFWWILVRLISGVITALRV